MLITLPSGLKDDLKWEQPLQDGADIIWHIDFKFSEEKISLTDNAPFFTFSIALEHFTKTIWPSFKDQTKGVCLYKGKGNFQDLFLWDEIAHKHFKEWISDMEKENRLTPFDFRLFCANVFGEYLQRLISFLPDTVSVFTDFDEPLTAQTAFLLSKERFPHLNLGAEPYAICLPQDQYICPELIDLLDEVLEFGEYKLIPESLLTEEWDGVEQLAIFSNYISPQGKRKLQGFVASGGIVNEITSSCLGIR